MEQSGKSKADRQKDKSGSRDVPANQEAKESLMPVLHPIQDDPRDLVLGSRALKSLWVTVAN